jgi:hypothetical protein
MSPEGGILRSRFLATMGNFCMSARSALAARAWGLFALRLDVWRESQHELERFHLARLVAAARGFRAATMAELFVLGRRCEELKFTCGVPNGLAQAPRSSAGVRSTANAALLLTH